MAFFSSKFRALCSTAIAVLMALACAVVSSQSVQAGVNHFLTSVAAPADSWLRGDGKTFFVPNEVTTVQLNIDTNVDVKISGRPTWADITQDSIGHLTVKIKSTNKTTNARRGTMTLKARDGMSASITLLQPCDSKAFLLTDKDKLVFCSDKRMDSIVVTCNKPYTYTKPEWLKVEKDADGTLLFSSKRIYDVEKERGDVVFFDETGAQIGKVPAINYSSNHLWVEKPVFAVISDIHFGDKSNAGWDNRAKRYLPALSSYPNLHHIVVVGDIANNGQANYDDNAYHTEEEYKNVKKYFFDPKLIRDDIRKIIVRGNHDWFPGQTGFNLFTQYIDPVDNHCEIIDGYPFITMGADNTTYGGEGLDATTLAWLRESLAKMEKACPDKPIFVFQHVLPHYTIIGSYPEDLNAYGEGLDEIFSDFPQVIDFSGHTHWSVCHPQSIYQKNYTAVNDGSCKQTNLPKAGMGMYQLNAQDDPGYNNLTEALILHINEEDEVVLERWITSRNEKLDEDWIVSPPFNTRDHYKYPYTRTGGKKPWWPESASIKFSEVTSTGFNATFPQALDDNEGINRYIVKAYINNTQVASFNQSALQQKVSEQPTQITMPLRDLTPGAEVTVKVWARDYYELESAVLQGTVKMQ